MFLTGQAEIHLLCKKLRRTFPPSAVRRLEREGEGWDEGEGEGESRGKGRRKRKRRLGQVGRRKKRSAWLQRPEVKVDLDEYVNSHGTDVAMVIITPSVVLLQW